LNEKALENLEIFRTSDAGTVDCCWRGSTNVDGYDGDHSGYDFGERNADGERLL